MIQSSPALALRVSFGGLLRFAKEVTECRRQVIGGIHAMLGAMIELKQLDRAQPAATRQRWRSVAMLRQLVIDGHYPSPEQMPDLAVQVDVSLSKRHCDTEPPGIAQSFGGLFEFRERHADLDKRP